MVRWPRRAVWSGGLGGPGSSPETIAVAGPEMWNNLPLAQRDPSLSCEPFWKMLKTFLFFDTYVYLAFTMKNTMTEKKN